MKIRVKKLVNRDLQLKMIAVFVALAGTCVFLQLLLSSRSIMGLLKDTQINDPAVLERIPGLLSSNFAIALAILVPLMAYVGLLLTQRIAGPAYRFEQYLDQVLAGEAEGPCVIRKGDEFQTLCDRINAVTERLQAAERAAGIESTSSSADEPAQPAADAQAGAQPDARAGAQPDDSEAA